MPITDWPVDDRPREKLLAKGADALSDAELLAIFLRVGLPGKSAVALARDLLSHFGSLNALFSTPLNEFAQIPGMGNAKYAQLQAVLEMSKRALQEAIATRRAFGNPEAVRDYLRLWLGNELRECFGVLFLDSQHGLQAAEILFRGTIDQATVHPRELVKRALTLNAAAVILAHNHPSGSTTPSQADVALTHRIASALELIDVRLLDHFVVTSGQAASMAELGLLRA
ncbi:MAG: DNA repair protein RadC [Burkholderiales bacterium]|nr:DNA repair protein RadC [Burkholderiales bacterium]